MRITPAPLYTSHPRLHRLRQWLTDGQYDRWVVDAPDGNWRWKLGTAIEEPGLRAICLIVGHDPEQDQCGIPEHDFCMTCRKLTPSKARERR